VQPVEWGKEVVSELVLTPTARFFRDVELTAAEGKITYKPYPLAAAGVAMAGKAAGAEKFVDKMHPADMNAVAQQVIVFLAPDPKDGSER
jgi:hypothetical protein